MHDNELTRLADRMIQRSQDALCGKDAIAFQEFAAELRTLAQQQEVTHLRQLAACARKIEALEAGLQGKAGGRVFYVAADDCMFRDDWNATTPIIYSSKEYAPSGVDLVPLSAPQRADDTRRFRATRFDLLGIVHVEYPDGKVVELSISDFGTVAARKVLNDLIDAHHAVVVVDDACTDFVTVPRVPTRAMEMAGRCEMYQGPPRFEAAKVWQRMLAAALAPQPKDAS